ncbi:MAG: hypothetical protein JKY54_14830, partial [Flavobacteriales bacterium]|nr:hypothetical protein [Flavobacteriales bacterium]
MDFKKIKYFWAFALLLTPMFAVSQTAWQEVNRDEVVKVYSDIGKFYFEKEAYHIKFKYSSYKGHHSSVAHEQSNGELKRKGKLICVESLGVKTIQDEKIKVIVDKRAKMIGVYHPETVYYRAVNPEMDQKTLTYAEKFYKRESGNKTEYKILFKPSSGMEKVLITVGQKYFLKEITTYYSAELEWEDENGNKKKSKAKL